MSKLPGDVKRRKATEDVVRVRTLDSDLRERKIEQRIPYSHKNLRRAAVEWLVATDQVSNSILFKSLCVMI